MNSPATDLASLLATAAIGTFAGITGWSIYVNREPNDPDSTITLYDVGGTTIDGLCDTERNDDFRIQVRVRNNSYTTAYQKALAVEAVLDVVAQETIDSTYYNVIYRIDLISSLGQDEKDRSILVQTYGGLRSLII